MADPRSGIFTRMFRRKAAPNVTFSPRLIEVLRTWDDTPASYAQVYRTLAPVRTVVDFIADQVASTSLKVYERADHGRPEARDHPLAVTLRRPNPEYTTERLIGGTVRDVAIYGVAYWWKVERGSQRQVVPLPPSKVQLIGGDFLGPEAFELMRPDGERIRIRREDMVYFRLFDPEDRRVATSKLAALRSVLAEEIEMSRYRKGFWRNSARQGGIIERPLDAPELSDEARERFLQAIKEYHAGASNSGNTLLLEEGMTWNASAFSPRDAEFITGRQWVLEATARVFNLPLAVLSLTETATYASQREFKKQLYQDTLPPWYRLIEGEIDAQLLPWWDPSDRIYTEFNIDSKLEGDLWEKFETLTKVVGRPFATVQEARDLLNWSPRSGSDDERLFIPSNNGYLEGLQPPAPAAPPAQQQAALEMPIRSAAEIAPARGVRLPSREAPSSVLRRRDQQANMLENDLLAFFARQEQATKSRLGAMQKALVASERWDNELADLLLDHSLQISKGAGRRTARQVGGNYDVDRTVNYVTEVSRVAAEKINQTTQTMVEVEGVRDGFNRARTRAAAIAMGVATSMNAFGRNEAAKQNGVVTKTWIVTSAKSRHPQMDGETVGIEQPFSNGLRWPGDAEGSSDETAHCQCLLDIGTGA